VGKKTYAMTSKQTTINTTIQEVQANKVGEALNPHQFHFLMDRFGRSKSQTSNISYPSLNPKRRRTSTTREREGGARDALFGLAGTLWKMFPKLYIITNKSLDV
jgi:hypothetical protein